MLEFENQNTLINYPFSENAVLFDTEGEQLDSSLIVDASFFPQNPVGKIYLASLDFFAKRVIFNDDKGEILEGDIPDPNKLYWSGGRRKYAALNMYQPVRYYDAGAVSGYYSSKNRYVKPKYRRPAGALIVSRDFFDMAGRRYFTSGATIASACISPCTTLGVTHLYYNFHLDELDSERRRIVGMQIWNDVTFTSSNNTLIPVIKKTGPDSYSLHFDAYPERVSRTFEQKEPIRKIYVQQLTSSKLRVSKHGANLQIRLANNVSRQDVCDYVNRDKDLTTHDTCLPTKPSWALPVRARSEMYAGDLASSSTLVFDVSSPEYQGFSICAPDYYVIASSANESSGFIVNPLNIQCSDGGANPINVNITPDQSKKEREAEISKLATNSSASGIVSISCPGL